MLTLHCTYPKPTPNMSAAKLMAALLLANLAATAAADEPTPRERQAKLAREAAVGLRVYAVRDAEREAVLAARAMHLWRNHSPAAWVWTECDPWLRAVAVMGATSLAALAALGWLAARPIERSPRA
jgi:hypothetical protein